MLRKRITLLYSKTLISMIILVMGYGCVNKTTEELLNEQGGIIMVVEVSVEDVLYSLASNKDDSLLIASINKAREQEKNSESDFLTLFIDAFTGMTDDDTKLAQLFNKDRSSNIRPTDNYNEVKKVLHTRIDEAFERIYQILTARLENYKNIRQPNLKKIPNTLQIQIELPGVVDALRIRKLVSGIGKLGFWETYDNTEVYRFLALANNKIREMNLVEQVAEDKISRINHDENKSDTIKENSLLSLMERVGEAQESEDIRQQNELKKFEQENPLFVVLRPNVNNSGQLMSRTAAVGISRIEDTAKVNSLLALKEVKELLPKDLKLLWESKPFDKNNEFIYMVAIRVTNPNGNSWLDGSVIENAKIEIGVSGMPEVLMTMTKEGAHVWERLTRENIGKQIAIVLDNKVYSFPMVNDAITGGRSSITGNFSMQEAEDFANILKNGSLLIPVKLVKETIIQPAAN